MCALNAEHFKDEIAAYAFIEARVWPKGRICPHCGVVENSGALKGKSTRPGLYKCYACRKPFTVKVGTISNPAIFRCTSGCRRCSFSAPARRA